MPMERCLAALDARAEQAFGYNNRAMKDNPLNDSDRFALVVSQIVGRRITYKELTGKADARPF